MIVSTPPDTHHFTLSVFISGSTIDVNKQLQNSNWTPWQSTKMQKKDSCIQKILFTCVLYRLF